MIENGVCYLAMELHEYTLAEYIHMLRLNQGVDPLTVNRLTWQLLKGLTSLHENCGIPHGNIMVYLLSLFVILIYTSSFQIKMNFRLFKKTIKTEKDIKLHF